MPAGYCKDGPMNQLRFNTSFPKGFLYIDTTIGFLWIYNWNGRLFQCQDSDGQPIAPDEDNGVQWGVEDEGMYQAVLRPSVLP